MTDLPNVWHERNRLITLVKRSKLPVTDMGVDFTVEPMKGEFTYVTPEGKRYNVTIQEATDGH